MIRKAAGKRAVVMTAKQIAASRRRQRQVTKAAAAAANTIVVVTSEGRLKSPDKRLVAPRVQPTAAASKRPAPRSSAYKGPPGKIPKASKDDQGGFSGTRPSRSAAAVHRNSRNSRNTRPGEAADSLRSKSVIDPAVRVEEPPTIIAAGMPPLTDADFTPRRHEEHPPINTPQFVSYFKNVVAMYKLSAYWLTSFNVIDGPDHHDDLTRHSLEHSMKNDTPLLVIGGVNRVAGSNCPTPTPGHLMFNEFLWQIGLSAPAMSSLRNVCLSQKQKVSILTSLIL